MRAVVWVIRTKDGVCSDARIVLGAEASVRGKRIDENTATKAARVALADARRLSMKGYKIEIARTLVKSSILGESC